MPSTAKPYIEAFEFIQYLFFGQWALLRTRAAKLGITEITVKVHRGHMMQKMKARSLIDLLEMADLLGIRRPKP